MKILFNNKEDYVGLEIEYVNDNIIEVKDKNVNISGFKIYHDSNDLLGDYSNYTTLYRELENSYQLSNDGSVYINTGIDEGISQEQTLDDIKNKKIRQMNSIQQNLINQGTEVELSDGTKETFTLNTNDQLSLNSLSVKNLEGLTTLPWHPSDESVPCKFYSEEDMKKITDTCMNFVTYHVTYFRDLRIYIRSLQSKEEVEAIEYGIDIPIQYQSEVLQALLMSE